MKGKNAGYDKLTEFRLELQNIVLKHLQTEMPPVKNQWQKNEIGYFITQITKDKNHSLYPQLEIIRFFNAILGELDKYLKELEFSRDSSTREFGIEFLTMVLNAIKIIGTLHAEEQTVRINRKDYTIRGITGYRSVVTFWLVEYPTDFAKSLEEFHTRWKRFDVKNIIADLNSVFSPRAIKEKKKKEMELQESREQQKTVGLFLAAPPIPSPNPQTTLAADTSSEAELSEGREKQEKAESNSVSTNSDAVLSEGQNNTSSGEVQPSESEATVFGITTGTVGKSTDINDLNDNEETQPSDQRIKEESEFTTEEESEEANSGDKVGSRSTHPPTAYQVRESDEEADDDDEYTYEAYYEDEEESSVVTEEPKQEAQVALPSTEHTHTKSEVNSQRFDNIPKLEKQRSTTIRRYIDNDGASVEEIEIIEDLSEVEEPKDQKQPREEEIIAGMEDILEEVREFREDVEDNKGLLQPITPPRDSTKREFPSTGFSAIKGSNPDLYNRLVRRSLSGRNSLNSDSWSAERSNTVVQETPAELSPMSALLDDSARFLEKRSEGDSIDRSEIEDGDGEDSRTKVPRALTFGHSGSGDE